MGAFFLYHHSESINLKAVQRVIEINGFDTPHLFNLGDYTLLMYRKQLIDEENYLFNGDSAVFCTGTPIYRGLSYRPTLQAVLADFMRGDLDHEQFLGNYCLIFYHNKKFSILIDELAVQHIFINKSLRRVSSSFLVLLTSFDHKLHLNKPAFYEKVTTGYLIGPDTLVEDISQVTPLLKKQLFSKDIQFIDNHSVEEQIEFHNQGIHQSVDEQIQELHAYFAAISALCSDYKTRIGLSGGYDSRLLYGLSKHLPVRFSAYTHATSGVHEHEVKIVKRIVEDQDTPLTMLPTKPARQYAGSEMEDLLKDCMYFSDGRSGFDMSTFSPVYTRSYRIKIMGESCLMLNGSGGEIYRNYSHTRRDHIDWREWMKAHVFYTNIHLSVPQHDLMEDIYQFVTSKISSRLKIDFHKKVDQLALLRYFAEIRMPDSKSVYGNAQNQLGFYLAPFIEKRIVNKAYRGSPYTGNTGTYEALMIEKIDRELAAIQSSYGYPLNAEPLASKLFYGVKCLLPDRINNCRYSLLRKFRNYGVDNLTRYQESIRNCGYMHRLDELFNTCFPEIRWSELVRNNLAMAMITHTGTFLYEFDGHLDL